MSTGIAIAETTGGLAQSAAQSASLGLIGSSLTGEQCDGGEARVSNPTSSRSRPAPTTATATRPTTSTEAPIGGTTVGGGRRAGVGDRAAGQPRRVDRRSPPTSPGIRVSNGRSVAEAEVFETGGRRRRGRRSTSTSPSATSITLEGLRWTARHRTGAEDAVAEGAFTIGALEVLGVPVPVDSTQPAADAINAALAQTGLRIELPTVQRIEEPVDLVRVTPLRLLIDDSPLGAAAVRPALELSREARGRSSSRPCPS